MTSMNYNHGLLPRLLVSGWLEIGEREEGGAGLLIPAPHLKGFSLWLSWVLVITSSLCPLRPHCFLLHHYFWWFPFTCREDSSDHWPNSPLSVLGSRCLLKCWRCQLSPGWMDVHLHLIFLLDPRVEDWLLMSSPLPQTIILGLYVYFVTSLGPKFMENRKPFELKKAMITYNFFIVLFSMYICYEASV